MIMGKSVGGYDRSTQHSIYYGKKCLQAFSPATLEKYK